jgi:uncharacterized membrane protein
VRGSVLIISSTVFLAGTTLLADGFVIPFTGPTTHTAKARLSSDAQRALLIWNDGQETLHLKSSYSGPAAGFAWIIPVPNLPQVKRSNWSIFSQAEKATRPRLTVITGYRFGPKGLSIGCSAPESEPKKQTPATAVRQLQSLNIRELHIEIVAAADSGGFIRWLHDHQYAVPEKADPILQRYIEADFYFIVVKISKSSSWAKRKGVTETVSGSLTPLAITFATERPFYPLAISSISAAPENELLLLAAAPLRLEPVGYVSDRLTYEDIEKTIVPQLRKSRNVSLVTSVDFTAAVRAAQKRAPSPALITESAVPMAWRGWNYSMLVAPRSVYADEKVVISRFHAFLKPHQMEDISFVPAKGGPLTGSFFIDLAHPRYDERPSNASAGVIMVGLITAIVSKNRHCRKGALQKLALILVLLGLILG